MRRSCVMCVVYTICCLSTKFTSSLYLQRCDNCRARPECGAPLTGSPEFITARCKDLCDQDDHCQMSVYSSTESSCKTYNCRHIQEAQLGVTAFRYSNNSECSRFTLRTYLHSTGHSSCEPLFYVSAGITSYHDCVDICLDQTGCQATAYSFFTGQCSFYNCTYYSDTSNLPNETSTYVQRTCNEGAQEKTHMQTCMNCDKGSQCQTYFNEINTTEIQRCGEECNASAVCDVGVYTSAQNICELYNCPLVQESCGKVIVRKSSNDDCLLYEIKTFPKYGGTCGALASYDGISHLEYCLDICLDTTGCRSLSYYQDMNRCILLHSCGTLAPFGEGWTFVNRTCLDSNFSPRETLCQIPTTKLTTDTVSVPSKDKVIKSSQATFKITEATTAFVLTQATRNTPSATTVYSTIPLTMTSTLSGMPSTSTTQFPLATYIASSSNFFSDAGRVVALFTTTGLTTMVAAGVCIYCLKLKWSGIMSSHCRNSSSSSNVGK